jgi:hypothetical protein
MKEHKGNYSHGLSYSPLYKVWQRMMEKVERNNAEIESKWRYIQSFIDDMDQDVKDAKSVVMTRILKDGPFNKENCKFKIG